MNQEDIDKLNKEQAMEVGRQFAYPLFTGSGYPINGLTKREFIAINLLNGYLSSGNDIDIAVEQSIKATDRLLIELNKNR